MARKVVIVGAGMVGASYAYSMVNQNIADDIVMIDLNNDLASAHAQDMSDGNVFLPNSMRIRSGDYSECADADIVCITAGAIQKEGQTRLDLAVVNAKITKNIVNQVMETKFNGILLIAINPVDVMTYVAQKVSSLDKRHVIGSGTNLDSARLKKNIANYLNINSQSVHAMIIGEHGDSSLAVWSSALVGPKPMLEYIAERKDVTVQGLEECYTNARDAAYKIIENKGSTYFGIGLSLAKITSDILTDQDRVLPLSVSVDGMYNLNDMYISLPAIVGNDGIKEVLSLNLSDEEYMKLINSANMISETIDLIKSEGVLD